MNTLTKLVLGAMGALRPEPALGDTARRIELPPAQRDQPGAISQNGSLYCAANGLATVLRAWIDREAIARALGLTMSQHVLLSQTVGLPA